MYKKRKAQANILTTVLIITLVIVAFVLVFNIVKPLIKEKSREIPTQISRLQTADLKVNGFTENQSAGTISVTLAAGTGENVSYVQFVITTPNKTCYVTQQISIFQLETKTFTIPNGGCYGATKVDVQVVSSSGSALYINNCSGLTEAGKIYYLNRDIIDSDFDALTGATACFEIKASNITFDCQGHSISGIANSTAYKFYRNGFIASSVSGITIKNCNFFINDVYNNGQGAIGLYFVKDAYIINNLMGGPWTGIYIADNIENMNFDHNINIINNTFNNNYWRSITIENEKGVTITGNKINGGRWGIYLNNNLNVQVINNEVKNQTSQGIYNGKSSSTFTNNTVCGNPTDFQCYSSSVFGAGNTFTNVGSCGYWPILGVDYDLCIVKEADSCIDLNESGTEYKLTKDLTNTDFNSQNLACFSINADNIILDCQGHSISSTSNHLGISSQNHSDIMIKNCNFYIKDSAINLAFVKDLYIIDNTFNDGTVGIYIAQNTEDMTQSSNINVIDNSFNNNYWQNINIQNEKGVIIAGNNINHGKWGIYLDNNLNVQVMDNEIKNQTSQGIYNGKSSSNFTDNIVCGNPTDFQCYSSSVSGTGNQFKNIGACENGWPVLDNNYEECGKCTDTDGGINYTVAGNVSATGYPMTYPDTCSGNQYLVEYYCNDTQIATDFVKCDGGCLNGACQTPNQCIDTDGGINYTVFGTTSLNGNSYIDNCTSTQQLQEYFCNYSIYNNRTEIFSSVVPCPGGCLNGACQICTDTDGGKNYNVSGTINTTYGFFADSCINSSYLKEYYCGTDIVRSVSVKCPGGCLGSRCEACIDTDGGRNYTVAGNVSAIGYPMTYPDVCSSNYLIEYYCNNTVIGGPNYIVNDFILCPNGCSNGACL